MKGKETRKLRRKKIIKKKKKKDIFVFFNLIKALSFVFILFLLI